MTADELMAHIKKHTRKGSVITQDTFRSYNSLKRWGKHHRLNHGTAFAYRSKNHINGIEDFWSFAKHILYNYRGVSKYHFPMYLERGRVPVQSPERELIQTLPRYLFWLRFAPITFLKLATNLFDSQ